VSTVFVFFTNYMMSAVVPTNIKSVVACFVFYFAFYYAFYFDGEFVRLSRGVLLFFLVLIMFFVTVFVAELFVFVGCTTE
jgi:hypothetical protein